MTSFSHSLFFHGIWKHPSTKKSAKASLFLFLLYASFSAHCLSPAISSDISVLEVSPRLLIIDSFPHSPSFTMNTPISISLELLVIFWPLKRPSLSIYLLQFCTWQYCFPEGGSWVDFDLITQKFSSQFCNSMNFWQFQFIDNVHMLLDLSSFYIYF